MALKYPFIGNEKIPIFGSGAFFTAEISKMRPSQAILLFALDFPDLKACPQTIYTPRTPLFEF